MPEEKPSYLSHGVDNQHCDRQGEEVQRCASLRARIVSSSKFVLLIGHGYRRSSEGKEP